MTLVSGTRLGRYQIRHKLGSGGMGEVYLAWDPELEREVAIKVLRADQDESPERTRRFVQEAKASSAFSHPNVAHVYEIGTAGDLRYIAMEVVQGETLRQRIARGEMPVDDVISIASQIAAALSAAHGSGIVHRDMKPENVIVRPDGYVKVLDFGLAKLVRLDSEAETLLKTRPGAVMGTPCYMAPEQFGGSDVTPPADVFSLGVVLYEMLTGRRPFDGDDNTALARAILSEDPVPPTKLRDAIPSRLCEILTKALQKDPELRYPSAAELLEDLKQVSRETTAAAVVSSRSELAAPRRRRWIAIAITLLTLIVAAVVIVAAQRVQSLREARAAVDEAQRLVDKRDRSIAVLPFQNLSAEAENAFFAAGVHEDVLTYLSRVADLKVISRSSVMQYASPGKNLREIAADLGVVYVVEGSVRRAGDRIRVAAQLIDARTDEHLWAENYDRELADVFTIQTAIAQEIVAALKATLSPREAKMLASWPTTSIEAYDLFLRARQLIQQLDVTDPGGEPIRLLEEAIRLDPQFAHAYALLATEHGKQYWFLA
ncbi:MAG TPA: protein kinase, partial [Thermoanaerobaculia bacterium]|nr:protein kinase [Thermoanaerobaculia bacterium]